MTGTLAPIVSVALANQLTLRQAGFGAGKSATVHRSRSQAPIPNPQCGMDAGPSVPALRTIVSVHDVMPSTLSKVTELLDVIGRHRIANVTLLVVPGRDWSNDTVDRLRMWQASGYSLAGHGWVHRCRNVRGFYHRLHSRLVSRHAAEHLDATPQQRNEIMQRCAQWFDDQRLGMPNLYVPPAWAMGQVNRASLIQLPFRMYETLAGVYHVPTNSMQLLPLAGFEADTVARQVALRLFNRANRFLARCAKRPLRLALHPNDLQLRLQGNVHRLLKLAGESQSYDELAAEHLPAAQS